jgi:hypothetical protein
MFNIEGNYLDFNEKDILGLLNKEEALFYKSKCLIKSNDDFSKWLMFYNVQAKIIEAYKLGELKPKAREVIVPRFAPYVVSDSLGVQGVVSQADGKLYDSKSSYYSSLKAQGMVVMGNDAPTTKATPKTQEIDWKQAVAETIKSTPSKGRA